MTGPAEVLVELDRDGTIENEWSLMEFVDPYEWPGGERCQVWGQIADEISYRSERVPSLYAGPLWDASG